MCEAGDALSLAHSSNPKVSVTWKRTRGDFDNPAWTVYALNGVTAARWDGGLGTSGFTPEGLQAQAKKCELLG